MSWCEKQQPILTMIALHAHQYLTSDMASHTDAHTYSMAYHGHSEHSSIL